MYTNNTSILTLLYLTLFNIVIIVSIHMYTNNKHRASSISTEVRPAMPAEHYEWSLLSEYSVKSYRYGLLSVLVITIAMWYIP